MIQCPSCGKANQGHFKFCLGCGSELPAAAPSPRAVAAAAAADRDEEITQHGVGGDRTRHGVANDLLRQAEAAAGVGEPDSEVDPPTNRKPARARQGGSATPHGAQLGAGRGNPSRLCPKCGSNNEPGHKFCASCGTNLVAGRPSPYLAAAGARLTALNPDGSEGNVIPLIGPTTVGRATGGIFAADQYLSPQHASFTPQPDHVVVTDSNSLNGVFRKLATDQRYQLRAGQVFRIGQELIRFETLHAQPNDAHGVEHMGAPSEGYVGRIAMVLGRNTTGTAFPIPETGLNLGRERGEVLFSDDGYVSGLHCRLSFDTGRVYLTDLGSSNGTFVKVIGSEHFATGEVLLMGQQLFRVTI